MSNDSDHVFSEENYKMEKPSFNFLIKGVGFSDSLDMKARLAEIYLDCSIPKKTVRLIIPCELLSIVAIGLLKQKKIFEQNKRKGEDDNGPIGNPR